MDGDSLMTIRDQEIRIQPRQIQRDMSNPVRGIDTAQHAQPSALLGQPLKRKPQPRHRTDGIEHRHLGPQPLPLQALNDIDEPRHHLLMLTGELIALHLPRRDGRVRLQDGEDGLLARGVDGVEIHDHVLLGLVEQVAQHRVDAQRGVLHEDARVERRVEEAGDAAPRPKEQVRVGVAHEFVRAGFGEGLEVPQRGEHCVRVGAEGACWGGGVVRGGGGFGRVEGIGQDSIVIQIRVW